MRAGILWQTTVAMPARRDAASATHPVWSKEPPTLPWHRNRHVWPIAVRPLLSGDGKKRTFAVGRPATTGTNPAASSVLREPLAKETYKQRHALFGVALAFSLFKHAVHRLHKDMGEQIGVFAIAKIRREQI